MSAREEGNKLLAQTHAKKQPATPRARAPRHHTHYAQAGTPTRKPLCEISRIQASGASSVSPYICSTPCGNRRPRVPGNEGGLARGASPNRPEGARPEAPRPLPSSATLRHPHGVLRTEPAHRPHGECCRCCHRRHPSAAAPAEIRRALCPESLYRVVQTLLKSPGRVWGAEIKHRRVTADAYRRVDKLSAEPALKLQQTPVSRKPKVRETQVQFFFDRRENPEGRHTSSIGPARPPNP